MLIAFAAVGGGVHESAHCMRSSHLEEGHKGADVRPQSSGDHGLEDPRDTLQVLRCCVRFQQSIVREAIRRNVCMAGNQPQPAANAAQCSLWAGMWLHCAGEPGQVTSVSMPAERDSGVALTQAEAQRIALAARLQWSEAHQAEPCGA